MKYLLTSWKTGTNRHQVQLENADPTKTTRIRGYGMGVTFSSRCFSWTRNFSATASYLKFMEPTASR